MSHLNEHEHCHDCGCDHEHDHGHDHEHGGEFKIGNIIIGFICLAAGIFVPDGIAGSFSQTTVENIELVIFLIGYLVAGGSVIKESIHNISKGEIFDENFLMMIASLGAFFIGEYPEGVAVMLFYQIGEAFQSYAVGRSRKSITELMDIRPDYANLITGDGTQKKVSPEDVKIGDLIIVKPGEKIPLDGKIVKGNASLDTSALTGESLPRNVKESDSVVSGSISIDGVMEIRVEKLFGDSTVSRIMDMVENASSRKAKTEQFITKFARIYTPLVVAVALLLAILPPLLSFGNWSDWIYRALTFLVISCPCALVISVPLSFFGGLGAASSKGILIKGSNYIESLAKCDVIAFDKTGTLTEGRFRVKKISNVGVTEDELLKIAVIAEVFSNHPIAISLKEEFNNRCAEEYNNIISNSDKISVKEISGYGIEAEYDNNIILAGNKGLLEKNAVSYDKEEETGTVVYVVLNSRYIGNILVADKEKEGAAEALRELREAGVKTTVMLTGDKKNIAEDIAGKLGISRVYAELLPEDKVHYVEKMLDESSTLAFVGDGINDAPVLARADLGIAMGALGSDAAIEAADVILMDDNIVGIAKAKRIAKKTIAIANQNIVFAIGVKVLILILAACGHASMWAAVFADVGVALIAVLNALRTLKVK